VSLSFSFQLLKTFQGYSPHNQAPDNPKAGHAMRIFALKFHPEYNQIFVTAGWDSTLKVTSHIVAVQS
jgi:hypothetical protein